MKRKTYKKAEREYYEKMMEDEYARQRQEQEHEMQMIFEGGEI